MKNSKVAIMQPYLFPYMGYYQLVNSVDTFVFYDDVNFIKQGWINRNNILQNGSALLFTIPLKGASSNKLIKEVDLNYLLFDKWAKKFMKTLNQSYSKAPFYNETIQLVDSVFSENSPNKKISDLAIESVLIISDYLEMSTQFKVSSIDFTESRDFDREKRIFDIVKKVGGDTYINAANGANLYSKTSFQQSNIDLQFIQSRIAPYPQFKKDFVPNLSIIDVLMFNSKKTIREMLNEFELS